MRRTNHFYFLKTFIPPSVNAGFGNRIFILSEKDMGYSQKIVQTRDEMEQYRLLRLERSDALESGVTECKNRFGDSQVRN